MDFIIHQNLAKKTVITDLPLCRVLLQDEKHYPWILLVPRRANVSRIMDLDAQDQIQLMKELDCAQKIVMDEFTPDQINVAAIGNKVPQLHVHVIGRYSNDPAWPGTVWDHGVKAPYPLEEKELIIQKLQKKFQMSFFAVQRSDS